MGLQFYQKHRGLTLNDIVGQDKLIGGLKKRFKEKNIPQALIFCAPSGSGKTTLARIVAMSVVCRHLDTEGNPCGVCEHCKDIIDKKFAMSVTEYNCSNILLEDMREFDEIVNTMYWDGSKRVIILDEFQELTAKASKNILKLMEDENDNVVFILTSMEKLKLTDAAKRRSQVFNLPKLTSKDISEYLFSIIEKEQIKVPDSFYDVDTGSFFTIVDNCNGSIGQAIPLLEQVIYAEAWLKADAEKLLDLYSNSTVMDICMGLVTQDIKKVFAQEWTTELLTTVRAYILNAYKLIQGMELNEFIELSLRPVIANTTKDQLKHILHCFFNLNKFYNWSEKMIDFYVLQAMDYEKENNVVRRR